MKKFIALMIVASFAMTGLSAVAAEKATVVKVEKSVQKKVASAPVAKPAVKAATAKPAVQKAQAKKAKHTKKAASASVAKPAK